MDHQTSSICLTLSNTLEKSEEQTGNVNTQICFIGEDFKLDEELQQAAQSFELPIFFSNDGQELMGNKGVVFVLKEFTGSVYEKLYKERHRIIAPPTLMYYADKFESLPLNNRPLYNLAFKNLIVCFNGFKKKESLVRMANLVHYMGGTLRKDFTSTKITHVVANQAVGEKYRYAANLSIPIMKESWIEDLWADRSNRNINAGDDAYKSKYRLPPFFGCKIGLIGFTEEDEKHLKDVALQNGGVIMSTPTDKSCTHVIVDKVNLSTFDECLGNKAYLVSAQYGSSIFTFFLTPDWFWSSIIIQACADESLYMIEQQHSRTPNSFSISSRPSRKSSLLSRGQKRKRLQDIVQLAFENGSEGDSTQGIARKRRSSEMGCLSVSASMLDATFSPDNSAVASPSPVPSPTSARKHVSMELLQTETNYVGILQTIVSFYEEAQTVEDLLDATDMKTIFGNITPIYEVHKKLKEDLSLLLLSWSEDSGIGRVFLKHVPEIQKAYPPFVNFFENSKEVLVNCDNTHPRFHAFLKQCQSKPECGRQSMVELMIRPVQRLPSVTLLLNDLLKHTPKSNPDHKPLEEALNLLKGVMTFINEDKRKTEGHMAMFDVVHDIENCPPDIISSHRSFITRADVIEAGEFLSHRGDTISLFLFSDKLEITKKRKSGLLTKSPNLTLTYNKTRHKFSFKHIEVLQLARIKQVVNIMETDECHNAFALRIHNPEENAEKIYAFVLQGEDSKEKFLATLCRHIANTIYLPDAENLLFTVNPSTMSLDNSEQTAVSKVMKYFTKSKQKLNRAWTMKRTPNKQLGGLSRAISSIATPNTTFATPNPPSRRRMSILPSSVEVSYNVRKQNSERKSIIPNIFSTPSMKTEQLDFSGTPIEIEKKINRKLSFSLLSSAKKPKQSLTKVPNSIQKKKDRRKTMLPKVSISPMRVKQSSGSEIKSSWSKRYHRRTISSVELNSPIKDISHGNTSEISESIVNKEEKESIINPFELNDNIVLDSSNVINKVSEPFIKNGKRKSILNINPSNEKLLPGDLKIFDPVKKKSRRNSSSIAGFFHAKENMQLDFEKVSDSLINKFRRSSISVLSFMRNKDNVQETSAISKIEETSPMAPDPLSSIEDTEEIQFVDAAAFFNENF